MGNIQEIITQLTLDPYAIPGCQLNRGFTKASRKGVYRE